MLVTLILAAGKGTRMLSDTPKVLHPLLGAPLLEHALASARTLEPDLEVVVVGYGRDRVQDTFQGQGILWAVQEPQNGTGHAAHCGVEAAVAHVGKTPVEGAAAPGDASVRDASVWDAAVWDADIFIANGDLPLLRPQTLASLVEEHRQSGAGVTVLTCNKSDPTGYGRILRTPAGEIHDVIEEQDADAQTKQRKEINTGVYVFRAAAFRDAYSRIGTDNVQGEYYLTDVVVQVARSGAGAASVCLADETEIEQVNSRAELARASEILRERILGQYMRSGVTILDPHTTYIETGVRIGRDAVIYPFTMIERGVEVSANCQVGPFAHLRPGAHLEEGASIGNFVEIKNSRIGERTHVRHLSYVGDGMIGKEVNVGAGTIFANFDGVRKNTAVVEDGASVGSGTILVAPVKIGKGAVTGAGAVVLKGQDVPPGKVAVGVPARVEPKKAAGRKT